MDEKEGSIKMMRSFCGGEEKVERHGPSKRQSGHGADGRDAGAVEKIPSPPPRTRFLHRVAGSFTSNSLASTHLQANMADASSSSAATLASVQAYLTSKGYNRALASLNAESGEASGKNTTPLSLDDLAAKNAPRDALVTQMEVLPNGSKKHMDNSGPEEKRAAMVLRQDNTDVVRGFTMIRNWIEGSLDIYLVSAADDC